MSHCVDGEWGHGDGELRAHIEVARTERGWEVAPFLVGRDCVPEMIFQHPDLFRALDAVAWEFSGVVEEVDEINREEAA